MKRSESPVMRSRRRNRFGLSLIALSLVVLCNALFGNVVLAQKKGGGEVPAGTVYFSTYNSPWDVYGMAGDGSGKNVALPGAIIGTKAEPSALKYSNELLWLDRDAELIVLQRQGAAVIQLQLTQISSDIYIADRIHWSNSGLDDFISFVGRTHDASGNLWAGVYRLHVSGAEIASAMSAGGGGWVPFGSSDPRLELVYAIPFAQGNPNDNNGTGGSDGQDITDIDWSPDGSRLAYVLNQYSANQGASAYTLIIRDYQTGAERAVLGGKFNNSVFSPRWSPDGTRIVATAWMWVTTRNTSKFTTGIWSVNADGTGAGLLVPDPSRGRMDPAMWSPDGRYLALGRSVQDIGTLQYKYDIVRVRADGSGLTVLTSDMNPYLAKVLVGWR